MSDEHSIRRRAVAALLIVACWTFLALLFTPQTYLLNQSSPSPLTWGQALAANTILFYLWALITPLVLWLGRRFPIERRHVLRNLAIHFLLSLPFAFVHIVTLKYTNHMLLSWSRQYESPVPISALVLGLGATNVMMYWGILAVSQALNYFRKYQEREFRLAQAQLQALKMQLNPHFLFNTLNAISELVYEEPEAADRTITQLSDLLRLSLRSGQSAEVVLKDELDFLEKYIEIQQTLLQERLSVRIDVAAETLDARVPNMILQPLVENAIRHGIAPRAGGGHIEISAQRENGMLRLRVRDTGLGLGAGWKDSGKDGIGLANTRARLRHLYGDAHRFELTETPNGGLTVQMTFPFNESAPPELEDEDTHTHR
jgi:two-component system LytT family sensor kinase